MVAAGDPDLAARVRPGRVFGLASTVSTVGPPTPNARIIFLKTTSFLLESTGWQSSLTGSAHRAVPGRDRVGLVVELADHLLQQVFQGDEADPAAPSRVTMASWARPARIAVTASVTVPPRPG